MSIASDIKELRDQISRINRLVAEIRRSGGGGGESNTASNVGTAGTGIFDAKVGVDLQFRKLNPASNKVTIALDAPNKKVDVNVDPSKINLGDLGNVNVPAPSDDDVLTYDLATTKWIAQAAGGGIAVNPYAFRRTGSYYSMWMTSYGKTVYTIIRNKLYAIPFLVPVSQTFDRIAIEVTTARTNGACRLGIYTDDGNVYPAAKVLESAELDCTTVGLKEDTISQTLTPGLYWLAMNTKGDADLAFRAFQYQPYQTSYYALLGNDGGTNFVSPDENYWRNLSYDYGALPDPYPTEGAISDVANIPAIFLRKA